MTTQNQAILNEMGSNLKKRLINEVCFAESLRARGFSLVKSNWSKSRQCYDEARLMQSKNEMFKDEWIAVLFLVLAKAKQLKVTDFEKHWHIVRDALI